MVNQFLADKIRAEFGLIPTQQQNELIDQLSQFICSPEQNLVFLLKGCAGTGKTSLVSALIRTLVAFQQDVVLLAPTGRAAKVLSSYSGRSAFTIHRYIYRQKVVGELNGSFDLNFNRHKNAVFVVDEASMISNGGSEGNFGSGRLLEDLLEYVYNGEGNRIIFVGDLGQLPPVGELMSPALERSGYEHCGFQVYESFLTDVVRQTEESGILYNATNMRLLMPDYDGSLPEIVTESFTDIVKITGAELVEEIASAYSHFGMDDVIVISRSNKRVNVFNNGIRNMVLYREEELTTGDMVMVVKNNYFWAKEIKELDFIANGDVAEVKRVRHHVDMYGFRFADVLLYFPDYDVEIDAKIMLDVLQSEAPSLSYADNNRLYQAVEADYADVTNKRERYKQMKENPYLNALQVKFAYAVTCHKAQGGQWSCVFLDKGFVPEEQRDVDFLRWLYTAFTRATQKVYLVNWDEKTD
ncbi:MAG: AAA family ATPase [Paludibacteraceae bacterium]|nr:AAA family ATPase [Paludibacteraceae bacterium]